MDEKRQRGKRKMKKKTQLSKMKNGKDIRRENMDKNEMNSEKGNLRIEEREKS